MEYLLQIQISVDMVEIWISVEGKRKETTFCGLSITDIHFCVYVSPDFPNSSLALGFFKL